MTMFWGQCNICQQRWPLGSPSECTCPQESNWKGLTEDDVKAPIQRAMQYFGFDPTQYSLGGAATIGFLGLVKEIEAKLKEKNT